MQSSKILLRLFGLTRTQHGIVKKTKQRTIHLSWAPLPKKTATPPTPPPHENN
jgi:hypothetical protein